jgi:tetratricopeptide (TPR) repeat protein
MSKQRPAWLTPVVAVGTFLRQHARTILVCLPALVAGGAATSLAIAASTSQREKLTARYDAEAKRGFENKDYPRAQLCAERLAQLEGQSEESLFRLAQALDAQGHTGRTQSILDRIAPLDQPGYAPAQLWQAQKLLQKVAANSPQARDAEIHLENAVKARPNFTDAHAVLGQIYAFSDRAQEAEPHLALAVNERPELLLLLAQINAMRGETTTSRTRAQRAVEYYRERTKTHPDEADSRFRWSAALIFLEDFAGAEAVLGEGLARNDSPAYHLALARAYLAWSDSLVKTAPNDVAGRLILLERGLRQDPSNAALLARLVGLMNGSAAGADKVRAALKGMLAQGQASATAHFLLGLDAWQNNRVEEARLHWERSHELAPEFLGVTNNLAWVLSTGPNADLPRALKLIDLAIDQTSGELKARYRGTRGHVLVQMKRWKEALADLEARLPFESDNADLQRDLAAAYTGLGLKDQAAEHLRRAEQNDKKSVQPPDSR